MFWSAELAKHEAKLPNCNQGLENVSCSEKYMEFSLLNAAEVMKEFVHRSINASPNNRQ